MEEETEDKLSQTQFVEVSCSSSGKIRRFAAGTEAGFALYLINKKLAAGAPQAVLIEAVKEAEEPVSFGPNAILVNYGQDWKLQAVTDKEFEETRQRQQTPGTFPSVTRLSEARTPIQPAVGLWYIGKTLFAFAIICLLGAMLAMFLENLPTLISSINSLL